MITSVLVRRRLLKLVPQRCARTREWLERARPKGSEIVTTIAARWPDELDLLLVEGVLCAPNPMDSRPGWHRHPNGGGWVQDTATVSLGAVVCPRAEVRGFATVRAGAALLGRSVVEGRAIILGGARLYDEATAQGRATIHAARICGTSTISDGAIVLDNATVIDSEIRGMATVHALSWVENCSVSQGQIEGDWVRRCD